MVFDRSKGIGGSDAAAIFNLSKYKSCVELYLEKIGIIQSDIQNNKALERGKILEPFVKALFERDYGHDVDTTDTLIHKDHDFIYGNLDGVIKKENAITEFKTAGDFAFKDFGAEYTDALPKQYLMQVHHYMLVADTYEKVYVPVLKMGFKELEILASLVKRHGVDLSVADELEITLKVYVVHRNIDLEQLMVKKYKQFWLEHVQKRIQPNCLDNSDILQLFPYSTAGKKIVASSESEHLIEEIKQAKEEIKHLEEEIEEKKFLIYEELKDAEQLVDATGKRLCKFKTVSRKTLDIEAVKEVLGQSINNFYKTITTRRFII